MPRIPSNPFKYIIRKDPDMNQVEFEYLIDDVNSMICLLSGCNDAVVIRDIEVALISIEQKNVFGIIDSVYKMRRHIKYLKYQLTEGDKLWSKEIAFHIKSLGQACESVLIKCGWVFDPIKSLFVKKKKVDRYFDYEIDGKKLDNVFLKTVKITSDIVTVRCNESHYIDLKMTTDYLDGIIRYMLTGSSIAKEWINSGFNKEGALLSRLWEDIPVFIKILPISEEMKKIMH